jgi:hypothetical protein
MLIMNFKVKWDTEDSSRSRDQNSPFVCTKQAIFLRSLLLPHSSLLLKKPEIQMPLRYRKYYNAE